MKGSSQEAFAAQIITKTKAPTEVLEKQHKFPERSPSGNYLIEHDIMGNG